MKSVVVHRGARDHYQVARALHEHALLQSLVTDLYWPADAWWGRALEWYLPGGTRQSLAARWEPGLDHRRVTVSRFSGVLSHLASRLPLLPFSLQRQLVRWTDHRLGRKAQRLALRHDAAIVSYSYYAYTAFRGAPLHLPRILFQLHPHPASVRAILRKELADHPECHVSLEREWELALPQEDFARLVEETRSAHRWIAASSFTKQTMVEQGIPMERVAVVPYGVDLEWFTPGGPVPPRDGPLRVLFVGTINQRKGVRYLVEALEGFDAREVQLTVCGRVVDDLAVLRSSRISIDVRPNVRAEELRHQYRAADVFVLPSLAEGFGHVILEALACGLPVITTTCTAGPDLIRHGQEGFVVEPASSAQLAEALEWCQAHRGQLRAMRSQARSRAEEFTWAAFRKQVAALVTGFTAAGQIPVA